MKINRHNWFFFLLFFATTLLFIPGITGRFSDYQSEIWNLGHIGYFFLLISVLFPLIERSLPSQLSRLIVSILITLLLSGVIEMIQLMVGRMASVNDVINNLVGCLFALYRCQFRQLKQRGKKVALLWVLLLLLFWRLVPLLSITVDSAFAYNKHPVVADFETPFELLRWSSVFPLQVSQGGSNQLVVHLKPVGQYQGVTLFPRVANWSGYSLLRFEVYNSGAQMWRLHLRINDQMHDESEMQHYNDRYNTTLPLNPGWNSFQIDLKQLKAAPASRQMNMNNISKVDLFFTNEPSLATIRIDNIVLSND